MKIFDYMKDYGYEQLVFFHDRNTDLKAITCIHSTLLGPSLGGTRIWNYENEEDAIVDVLRLARGMSYKSSCAGLNLGGGKSVIIADPKALRKDSVRREAFFRAFGRFIEGLNGRYITAEDVNTTTLDMDYIKMETNYVCGLEHLSGNPSPFTALGVYKAILACCKEAYGEANVEGKVVAVQGVGEVGFSLCKLLKDGGAKLLVTDIDQEKIKRAVDATGATFVEMDDIYDQECDIYAPCALGGTINDNTIPRLKCKIVAGAANNVLLSIPVHGAELMNKGIIYAPDYVANAGGVMNVYEELRGYNEETVRRMIDGIYDRMLEIISISKEKNLPTSQVADEMGEARMQAIKNMKAIYLQK